MSPRNQADSSALSNRVESDVEPVVTEETHAVKRPPMRIVWVNVTVFILLHSAAVYALFLLPFAKFYTLAWSLFCYVFSGLGITAGAHRLWAHRSYKATLPLRILLCACNTMAFQNDLYEWSRDHRAHHKFSETDGDPHNAKRGFFFAHMGWLLVRKHPDVKSKGSMVDMSDIGSDPVVAFQRKYYKSLVVLANFVIPTVVPWYFWGESVWNAFFLSAILRYCLVLNATWCVNSVAHLWGMKPYDVRINPAENAFVCITAVGEGFHNYHHVFPQDYETGEYGWHMNLTTVFIDTMAFLGLAYNRTKMPKEMIMKRRLRTGNLSTKDSLDSAKDTNDNY